MIRGQMVGDWFTRACLYGDQATATVTVHVLPTAALCPDASQKPPQQFQPLRTDAKTCWRDTGTQT